MSLSSELSEYHDMVSQAVVVLDRDLKELGENTEALQGKYEELEGNLKENTEALQGKYEELEGNLKENTEALQGKYEELEGNLKENIEALQDKYEGLEGNLKDIKDKVMKNQGQSTLGLSTPDLAKLGAGSGVIALVVSILALVL